MILSPALSWRRHGEAICLVEVRGLDLAPLCLRVDDVDRFAAHEVLLPVLVYVERHPVLLSLVSSPLAESRAGRPRVIRSLYLNFFGIPRSLGDFELNSAMNVFFLLLVLLFLHFGIFFGCLFRIGCSQLLDLLQCLLRAIAHYCQIISQLHLLKSELIVEKLVSLEESIRLRQDSLEHRGPLLQEEYVLHAE